jgi:hypothetical protein
MRGQEDNIKMCLREKDCEGVELDSSCSEYGQVVGCFEHSNELWVP